MKLYQCHKRVHAAKIEMISDRYQLLSAPPKECATLHLHGGDRIKVDDEFLKKHKPEVGGYFVRYEDGYTSFSPAKAFEDGYAEVVPCHEQPSAMLDPEAPVPAAHPQATPGMVDHV